MRRDATDLRDRESRSKSITAQTLAETQVIGSRNASPRLREEVPEAPRERSPIRLEVHGPTKVLGADSNAAPELSAADAGKDEVHEKLGIVAGVRNARSDVRAAEIAVLMRGSVSEKSPPIRPIKTANGSNLPDGRDLIRPPQRELIHLRRRDMSAVIQSSAPMPHQSALDNAAFGLPLARYSAAERRQKPLGVLE